MLFRNGQTKFPGDGQGILRPGTRMKIVFLFNLTPQMSSLIFRHIMRIYYFPLNIRSLVSERADGGSHTVPGAPRHAFQLALERTGVEAYAIVPTLRHSYANRWQPFTQTY